MEWSTDCLLLFVPLKYFALSSVKGSKIKAFASLLCISARVVYLLYNACYFISPQWLIWRTVPCSHFFRQALGNEDLFLSGTLMDQTAGSALVPRPAFLFCMKCSVSTLKLELIFLLILFYVKPFINSYCWHYFARQIELVQKSTWFINFYMK